MLISYIILGLTVALLFVFPVEVLLPFTLALYSQLVLLRLYQRKYVKIDFIIFAIYFSMFFLYKVLKIDDILPYVGAMFYFFIGLAFLVSGVAARPITLADRSTKTAAEIDYHSFMDVVLGMFYLVCLYLSLSLMPQPAYIYLPLVLVAVSIPTAMILAKYLHQPYFGFYRDSKYRFIAVPQQKKAHFDNTKGFSFVIGDYIGKEVVSATDQEQYLEVLHRAYYDIYVQSKIQKQITYAEMWENMKIEHAALFASSTCFVVKNMKENACVGTLRIIHRAPKTQIETYTDLDFSAHRDRGLKVAEIGRFAIINTPGAERGMVLKLLFHLLGYTILRHKIDLAYTFAFNSTAKIYEKIGFKKYIELIYDEEFKMHGSLLGLNFRENFKAENSLVKNHASFWVSILLKFYYSGAKSGLKNDSIDLFPFN